MPSRLAARGNKNIDTGLCVLDGMFFCAGERTDQNTLRLGTFHDRFWRHTQCIDEQFDWIIEGNIEQF